MFEMPGWFRHLGHGERRHGRACAAGVRARRSPRRLVSAYAFLGAGEFEDWHDDIDRSLLDGRDGRVLVLATASAPEGERVYARVGRQGPRALRARSASTSRVPPLRTPRTRTTRRRRAARRRGARVLLGREPRLPRDGARRDRRSGRGCRTRLADGLALRGLQRRGRVPDAIRPTTATPTTSSGCWRPGSGTSPRSCSRRTGTSSRPGSPARARSSRGGARRTGTLVALDEHTAMVGDGATWTVHGRRRRPRLPRRCVGGRAPRPAVVHDCRCRRTSAPAAG